MMAARWTLVVACWLPLGTGLRSPVAARMGLRKRVALPMAQTVEEHLAETRGLNERESLFVMNTSVKDCISRVRKLSGKEGSKWSRRLTELGRVWVVDEEGKFGGYVGATELLLSEPTALLKTLRRKSRTVVNASDDLEATMNKLSKEGVAVAPVVDGSGVFLGALSPVEIMEELREAASIDVARYAASGSSDTYFGASPFSLIWNRATWLVSLLALQSVSSAALGSFSDLLQRHLSLALFLTMLTGTAGNAGNQSSAMVIRGLATGEIDAKKDFLKVARREAKLGTPLALLLGVASFGRVFLSAKRGASYIFTTAVVVGVSMATTVLSAILVGTGAPMLLQRIGVDPCNCASPALATVVDLLGVVVLCSIGQRFLP